MAHLPGALLNPRHFPSFNTSTGAGSVNNEAGDWSKTAM